MRLRTVAVGVLAATILPGCGGVAKAPPEAAVKPMQLQVSPARFSETKQRPGDEVTLSITVKNTGSNRVADLIVQLKGLQQTEITDVQDTDRTRTSKTDLPNNVKRPAWFIDDSPDGSPLSSSFLYPGGSLAPGQTRTLRWRLAAQQPGKHAIGYQVFGGLTDNAAKATTGTGLTGSVSATIAPTI